MSRPLDFFAYLVGRRPGAYKERDGPRPILGATVEVTVRSWADDAPWAKRVGRQLLMRRACRCSATDRPANGPTTRQPLTVQEAVSRSTGGYAGMLRPGRRQGRDRLLRRRLRGRSTRRPTPGSTASLLADRWANEAFASYYATPIAADVRRTITVADGSLTDELETARIPLNAWGPVGTEDVAQEDYAYAASLTWPGRSPSVPVAQGLTGRLGRRAQTASARTSRWAAAAETVEPDPPDWRGLLDLLEARTDATYDDLWRDLGGPARRTCHCSMRGSPPATDTTRWSTAGRDWHLPLSIRDAMRAWRFERRDGAPRRVPRPLRGRDAVTDAAKAAA